MSHRDRGRRRCRAANAGRGDLTAFGGIEGGRALAVAGEDVEFGAGDLEIASEGVEGRPVRQEVSGERTVTVSLDTTVTDALRAEGLAREFVNRVQALRKQADYDVTDRIKVSFEPFKVKRRTLGWLSGLLLRRQRGYRVIDHILTLNLMSLMFRVFRPTENKAMPKFLRKSAMGVETIFR